MWTHKHPYRKPLLTLKSIEAQGRMHLYRSLNIKRVIGFMGSGSSVDYGLPDWNTFTKYVVTKTLNEINREKIEGGSFDIPECFHLKALYDELVLLSSEKAGNVDNTILLGLCSELEKEYNNAISDQTDKVSINIRRKINKYLLDEQEENDAFNPEKTLYHIYYDLGIRRFLTLNYDTLIEQFLAQTLGFQELEEDNPVIFSREKPTECLTSKPVVYARNRLGRTASSIAMTSDTIGDLIGFSAFPFAHEAQIFHLHGRMDIPESIILTVHDYQKLYIQSNDTRRTFNEALELLFTGNDVLFLGIGMSEGDPLAPLRRYAFEERDRIWSTRRIFALLPYEGKNKSTQKAIELKIKYNVHTIYYRDPENDQKSLFEDEETKEKLSKFLCQELEQLSKGNLAWWLDWRKIPAQRIAIYPDMRYLFGDKEKGKDKDNPPLWSRHNTVTAQTIGLLEASTEAKKGTEASKRLKKLSGQTGNILRVTAPRGGGKDNFYMELQTIDQETHHYHYKKIFKKDGYSGAFFARTSFTVEFSSVILALVRFVAYTIAKENKEYERGIPNKYKEDYALYYAKNPGKIRKSSTIRDEDKDQGNFLWDESGAADTPHRLNRLVIILNRYIELMGNDPDKRLFICLKGVDLLVNQYGNGYSPCNRAFFRILTQGEGLTQEPPLNIVLISGKTDTPIRYLSETCEDKDVTQSKKNNSGYCANTAYSIPRMDGENCDKSDWPERSWLKSWTPLGNLGFNERYWLNDCPPHLNVTDGDISFQQKYPDLYNAMIKSVALDTWISSCARDVLKVYGNIYKRSKNNFDDPQFVLENWILKLDQVVTRTGIQEVLREVLKQYRINNDISSTDENKFFRKQQYSIRLSILNHLTLFRVPVTSEVLYSCKGVKKELSLLQGIPKKQRSAGIELFKRAYLKWEIKALTKRNIIIEVSEKRNKNKDIQLKNQKRYVLHDQMREFFAKQMGFTLPDRGERNYFEVSVYPVQPNDLPNPNNHHFQFIKEIVSYGLEDCRKSLALLYRIDYLIKKQKKMTAYSFFKNGFDIELPQVKKKIEDEDFTFEKLIVISQKIRAIFSILRENFSVGTLSRLEDIKFDLEDEGEPFEIYQIWLGGILNAAIAIDTLEVVIKNPDTNQDFPTLLNKKDLSNFETERPLYEFEIVWLLNERGVAYLVQGHLYDGLAVLKQAQRGSQRYSKQDDQHEEACYATERRIELNIAIALIERADITKARKILTKLVTRMRDHLWRTPSVTYALAVGYLGLCDHLNGNLRQAEKSYKAVIKYASDTKNLRAVSIFRRHYADLLRSKGKLKEARNQLAHAVMAASHDEQRDIMHLALIAQARIDRTDPKVTNNAEAIGKLESAMEYAQKMGLSKLKVEALKVRAEIDMLQGETEFAGRLAAQAMGLANRHGMRLRQISTHILYGQIVAQRGQLKLSNTITKNALVEAEKYGYQLKAQQAQAFLREHFTL